MLYPLTCRYPDRKRRASYVLSAYMSEHVDGEWGETILGFIHFHAETHEDKNVERAAKALHSLIRPTIWIGTRWKIILDPFHLHVRTHGSKAAEHLSGQGELWLEEHKRCARRQAS